MFKAAIFDLDGTMVDTEIIQSRAFEKILGEHGVASVLSEHGTVHTPGISSDAMWEILKKTHHIDTPTTELTARKRKAVLETLQGELLPMAGLLELLEEFVGHQIPMAVATSAKRERAELMLEKIGRLGHFTAIITADDVQKVKPAPDAYLAAAESLGVKPEECIVFEDTDVGVMAAKAAGMKAVAVPNKYTKHMDFSDADLVISSLGDATMTKLSQQFAQ